MISEGIDRIAPRTLWLVVGGFVVISVLAAYSFMLEPAFGRLSELREARALSSAELNSGRQQTPGIHLARLRSEIGHLQEALNGDQVVEPSGMVSHVVRVLDELSRQHGVVLHGVTPGDIAEVFSFTEIPFEVRARGRYFELYAWLAAAERALSPMVLKHFELRPEGASDVGLQLKLVAYRPPAEGA